MLGVVTKRMAHTTASTTARLALTLADISDDPSVAEELLEIEDLVADQDRERWRLLHRVAVERKLDQCVRWLVAAFRL